MRKDRVFLSQYIFTTIILLKINTDPSFEQIGFIFTLGMLCSKSGRYGIKTLQEDGQSETDARLQVLRKAH